MSFWPFWLGGVALASLPLAHWLLLKRPLGVAGRYSTLIDAVSRKPLAPSEDALIAAMREAALEEFGPEALAARAAPATPRPTRDGVIEHALFLLGLAVGGAIAHFAAAGSLQIAFLTSSGFAELFGPESGPLMLGLGGVLVGCGTRMAGGCTSGHGLSGVSQLQPGSLVATGAFFASGVTTALVLGGLR